MGNGTVKWTLFRRFESSIQICKSGYSKNLHGRQSLFVFFEHCQIQRLADIESAVGKIAGHVMWPWCVRATCQFIGLLFDSIRATTVCAQWRNLASAYSESDGHSSRHFVSSDAAVASHPFVIARELHPATETFVLPRNEINRYKTFFVDLFSFCKRVWTLHL